MPFTMRSTILKTIAKSIKRRRRTMTEAQKRAKAKYKQKVTRLNLEFYPTEQDLLDHINNQTKKQTYIKDLIRSDMNKRDKL